ncbi:MAG: NlpC/P60 family protein [Gammaproteobacteria bacterium]
MMQRRTHARRVSDDRAAGPSTRAAIGRAAGLLGLLLLGGCGLLTGGQAPIEDRNARPAAQVTPTPAPAPRPARDPQERLATVLYGHFREWEGVPYRYGGTTRQGIDCSAFVRHTFRHGLGVELPRTVSEQAGRGRRIGRDELSMGDLVFFRTGRSSEHVGIYLQRGEFMHASRRRGVMISRLSNRYWRAKFVQARRVLDDPAQLATRAPLAADTVAP